MTASLYCFDDLENVYDRPERVGRLAELLTHAKSNGSFVLGAGDNTALGALALLDDEGRGVAESFFETVAHDAETFGNHDLDYGIEWALDWAERVPPTYCCANLDGPGTEHVPGHTVIERDGTRIGVVGVTHAQTNEIAVVLEHCSFGDPVAAAREELAALRRRGVDFTVVCAHCGDDDRRIARETDADVVAGGHTHSRLAEIVDGTALVRGGGSDAVLEVTLDDRADTDPEIVVHETATGSLADGAVAESVADTYRERWRAAGATETVATLSEPIQRSEAADITCENRLGNFLTDAMQSATDADAALLPTGSLRTGPPLAGDVTVGNVVSLCPFDDTVREVELTGAELRRVLSGCLKDDPTAAAWADIHVAGLRVRWDTDGTVRSLERDDDGAEFDPEATYLVATTGWLVVTDAYHPIDESRVRAADVSLIDAMLDHARDGGLRAAAVEGRIGRKTACEPLRGDRTTVE
jgi:2',3'-cyclic-nucleotide 2'-phosphodiesterase (5'-nucleotidase family)